MRRGPVRSSLLVERRKSDPAESQVASRRHLGGLIGVGPKAPRGIRVGVVLHRCVQPDDPEQDGLGEQVDAAGVDRRPVGAGRPLPGKFLFDCNENHPSLGCREQHISLASTAELGDAGILGSIETVRDSRNLRKLLTRTLPDWAFTFHGIRHWFVSMGLAASGASLVHVSRLVGHRSTRRTQDIYGYLIDEGSSKVLDVVASALEIDRRNVKVSGRCQGGADASP